MEVRRALQREFLSENLQVKIYQDRKEMGFAAGRAVVLKIKELLQNQKAVTMIFAAAPSQNELLEALVKEKGIDWKRITAFHMDEYIGLSDNSPQLFRRYLEEHLFHLVEPGRIHFLNPNVKSSEDECQRYSDLLLKNPVDIVCCGIGENGHLAFNDPPVADFLDAKMVKTVELDLACRQQQVNDGCFPNLEEVPTHAVTLTIPTLLSARYLYCVVPGATKANAVHNTVFGPVSTACPASILRRHFRSTLYVERDSAKHL